MLVAIGTRSKPKIIAATKAFSKYPELWMEEENGIEYSIMPKEVRKADKTGSEVDNFSGVSCNPMTLIDTIQGAKNRAKNAYEYALEHRRHLRFWSRNRSWNVSNRRSQHWVYGL